MFLGLKSSLMVSSFYDRFLVSRMGEILLEVGLVDYCARVSVDAFVW